MTTSTQPLPAQREPRARGFTLVELMVAVTGGLIVAMIVFGLAREATRVYRQESRVADATLGAVTAFNRLSSDIAHAGFLSSPNVLRDPRRSGVVNATWPVELAQLASVRITPDASLPDGQRLSGAAGALLAANGRTPDQIALAGSLTNPEEFDFTTIAPGGTANTFIITLSTDQRAALTRFIDWANATQQTRGEVMTQLFPPQRGLRVVLCEKDQFATIGAIGVGTEPTVTVTGPLTLRGGTGDCLLGPTAGAVNVINFVRYRLADVQAQPGAYRRLFEADAGSEMAAWDQGRTELVREELTTNGAVISLEVVAEYAVDLEFGVTAITGYNGNQPAGLVSFGFGVANDANIATYAGNIATGATPERLRGIRARLSVRSRVPDRDANLNTGGPIAPGFYRMGLGPGATAPFARVRTLQAEIALRNHEAVKW